MIYLSYTPHAAVIIVVTKECVNATFLSSRVGTIKYGDYKYAKVI